LDKLEKHLTEDLEVASVKRTGINRYFNKLGIHVVRVREWESIYRFNTNHFSKLSSVQFLKAATCNPESFDEIYNLLADEASKIGTSNTELLMLSLVKKHTNYSHPQ